LDLVGVVAVGFLDSQIAIYLTKNNIMHTTSRPKHISIKCHHIKDTIVVGLIVVKKIHTLKNPAYMLTKPLSLAKFEHCLDLVGVHNI